MTASQVLAVLAGLLFAELISRLIATRKPADTPRMSARFAWYGRDAAAAIQRRPSAAQLLVPVLLAAPTMLIGSPFMWGTLLALMREVCLWHVAPVCLQVRRSNETSVANRLLSREQIKVQDALAQIFQQWDRTPSLADAQRGKVVGPLGPETQPAAPLAEWCEYTVQEGDDLNELLTSSGVSRDEVRALNPDVDWQPGTVMRLPRALCLLLLDRMKDK